MTTTYQDAQQTLRAAYQDDVRGVMLAAKAAIKAGTITSAATMASFLAAAVAAHPRATQLSTAIDGLRWTPSREAWAAAADETATDLIGSSNVLPWLAMGAAYFAVDVDLALPDDVNFDNTTARNAWANNPQA